VAVIGQAGNDAAAATRMSAEAVLVNFSCTPSLRSEVFPPRKFVATVAAPFPQDCLSGVHTVRHTVPV
jgi:hypothetical protein